jgi:hypothetical protein
MQRKTREKAGPSSVNDGDDDERGMVEEEEDEGELKATTTTNARAQKDCDFMLRA